MKAIKRPLDCGHRAYQYAITKCGYAGNMRTNCCDSYTFPAHCPLPNVGIEIKTPAEIILEWKEEIRKSRDETENN